ncbi:hypothetical protein SEUCBS139899_007976 [Sporothrix eucalyptigena]
MPATESTAGASAGDVPGGRKLFKGRPKPPKRDPTATFSSEPAIRQNELTVERLGASLRAPAIEVCSTNLPQPFLEPDANLGQQRRANGSV